MGVSADELAQIEKILSSEASPDVVQLRKTFPHLIWTKCDASDVIEEPYRSYERCDLHLLNGKDHCVAVTRQPAEATGLILAFRGATP
jgi:hypothetical protein